MPEIIEVSELDNWVINYVDAYRERYYVHFKKQDGTRHEMHIPDCVTWFLHPGIMNEYGYSTWGGLLQFLQDVGNPEDSYYNVYLYEHFYYSSDEGWSPRRDIPPETKLVDISIDGYRGFPNSCVLLPEPEEQPTALAISGEVTYNFVSEGPVFRLKVRQDFVHNNQDDLHRVLSYNFSPRFDTQGGFTFHKDRKDVGPHYGVEIEVSSRINPNELQRIVTDVEPKQEIFFYFKHDSSIYPYYDYSYEIVTMPCKKKFLIKNLRILFEKLDRLAKDKGSCIGDFFDCNLRYNNGLHIHVEKSAFRSRLVANRFASIWNQWSKSSLDLLNTFSKRPNGIQNQEYCRTHPNMSRRTLSYRIREGAVVRDSYERRSACREAPNTLEVRIFQGLFDLDHIINSIQVVDAMFYYAHEMSLSSFDMRFADSFKRWIRKRGGYLRVQKMLKGDK